MKRFLKVIALIISSIILILSLSGCNLLNEARNSQAFYGTNSDGISTITYGKTEYYLLPSSETLSPEFSSNTNSIFATKHDVPVLLSFFLGDTYRLSIDGTILISDDSSNFYCRADKYEDVSKMISNGFTPDGYCYIYTEYNPKTDDFIEKRVLLNEQEQAVIDEIINNNNFSPLPEMTQVTYDHCVNLYLCTADKLFIEYCLDLVILNDKYYLLALQDDGEYIAEINYEQKSVLKNIADTIIDTDDFYSKYWLDDETEVEE